ncbi:hypothetical protein [Spongiactinospora sp. TRM90649]|uniref:hypothetical protein n=1 Tax=Spongiactinospora sp. TRM90649 TaxID=3031114 RepID=UPI0023F7BB9A|nr:hypothetical protein [Spongiactinospora sp. TRM90649]MDF5755458.1 hypothetical protein [Spongiactinospora sp. TRM90649]
MRRLPAVVVVAALVLLVLAAGSPTVVPAAAPQEAAEGDDTGIHLLREAAYAGRTAGYTGVRLVTDWSGGSPSSALVNVRNVPGSGLTISPEIATAPRVGPVDPGSPAADMASPPDGMLDALARNYRVVTTGTGTACGRRGPVVSVLRADGTPAARYLIDAASDVVLRREIFDGRGRITQSSAFIELSVPDAPSVLLMAGTGRAGGPSAERVAALRERGWDFPVTLPGRLELFTAEESAEGYLHLGYSDGLSVVSAFVQRGSLDRSTLAGWHARPRDGHTIWIRGSAGYGAAAQQVVWTSGEHVYTVVADAPADMVDAAVGALPHQEEIGAWDRLCRGADRVLSWISPFA